jgi:putative CocE/NonD family hydrolase
MIQEKDIQVPVRDGVRIGVRVYRPEGAGPFPALFAASPYRYDNNELPPRPMFLWRETGPIEWYVEQGYAYVHADVRGAGISGGEFGFMSRLEQQDLYDVIEWIAKQKWSNGRIGGIGQSYYCMSQWFMGVQNPPHLACLAAYDGMNDPYRYLAFRGGIESNFPLYWFNASVRVPNLYPANGDNPRVLERDFYLDVQRHPTYDGYWKERAAAENLERITVPLYSIGVWAKMELHLAGNILGYQKASGPKKLHITGTATAVTSQVDFNNVAFHEKLLLPFYDKHLKGLRTSYDERRNVEYVVKNTGVARAFDSWPPPGTSRRKFFFEKGPTGSVTSLNDGSLGTAPAADGGSTGYAYPHPRWVLGVVAIGPQGPDPAAAVLTFTSVPLDADMEVAGHGKVILHASSTRNDMDFHVKVSEQLPLSAEERAKGAQPRYTIVTKGWLRASHSFERDPAKSTEDVPYYTHANPKPLEQGKIYEFEIPLMAIAWRFQKGNRIRVEIACGDSPITDGLFFHVYRPDKIGTDTIHHDARHPSQLILPVLEGV